MSKPQRRLATIHTEWKCSDEWGRKARKTLKKIYQRKERRALKDSLRDEM